MISKESKGLVKGEYGKTPVDIKPEIIEKIIGKENRITCRPADLIKPELEKLRNEAKQYIEQDEDVLSYALFDKVAVKFFEQRKAEKYKMDVAHMDSENKIHTV